MNSRKPKMDGAARFALLMTIGTFAVGITISLGITAAVVVGIYKLLEWMLTL